MDKENIKDKILRGLAFNTPPKYMNFKDYISNKEYQIILTEMIDEGDITANIIENHPVYEGEFKDIQITDQAKQRYNGIV